MCRLPVEEAVLRGWEEEGALEQLRDRFVTGSWAAAEARAAAVPGNEADEDDDEDADVFGDFEDIETGEPLWLLGLIGISDI